MLVPNAVFAGSGAISAGDAASAWKAAVIAASGTVSDTELGYVRTLIQTLQSNGVWPVLDYLLLPASENANQALIDLVGLVAATAVNSPTFTANQGYAGDGTTSYVNTNWVASTMGRNYAKDSAHLMIYNRTPRGLSVSSLRSAGAYGGAPNSQIDLFSFTTHVMDCCINDSTGFNTTSGASDSSGMWVVNRSGPSAAQGYRNGSSIMSGSQASTGVPTSAVFLGAVNNGGFFGGVTDQHAAISMGGSLNSTQQAAYSTALNAYMTSIGANVY